MHMRYTPSISKKLLIISHNYLIFLNSFIRDMKHKIRKHYVNCSQLCKLISPEFNDTSKFVSCILKYIEIN